MPATIGFYRKLLVGFVLAVFWASFLSALGIFVLELAVGKLAVRKSCAVEKTYPVSIPKLEIHVTFTEDEDIEDMTTEAPQTSDTGNGTGVGGIVAGMGGKRRARSARIQQHGQPSNYERQAQQATTITSTSQPTAPANQFDSKDYVLSRQKRRRGRGGGSRGSSNGRDGSRDDVDSRHDDSESRADSRADSDGGKKSGWLKTTASSIGGAAWLMENAGAVGWGIIAAMGALGSSALICGACCIGWYSKLRGQLSVYEHQNRQR
uniref:Transmembrane protein n=1 Tax=Ditylenchus dipsaci TaxID=166011 RepID=A0A915E1B9_9BILA